MEYPELVFEGMVIAGFTIGAKLGLVYLRGEYEYMLKSLEDYLQMMRNENLLGKNILVKKVLILILKSGLVQVHMFAAKKPL